MTATCPPHCSSAYLDYGYFIASLQELTTVCVLYISGVSWQTHSIYANCGFTIHVVCNMQTPTVAQLCGPDSG